MNEPTVLNKPQFSGRNDKRRIMEDSARYHLASGMARMALKAKVDCRPNVDCVGKPTFYDNRMAKAHSASELERMANGRKRIFSIPK